MRRTRALPTNYLAALTALGSRDSRVLCNNTRAVRHDDAVGVVLHTTEVVTFYADGRTRITLGGWDTVTTRARINACLPRGCVSRNKGTTYYSHLGNRGNDVVVGSIIVRLTPTGLIRVRTPIGNGLTIDTNGGIIP